jgi:hypothetical protein
MAATLLAVRIQVADFYRVAAAFLPLYLHVDVVLIDLLSQRKTYQPPKAARILVSGGAPCWVFIFSRNICFYR